MASEAERIEGQQPVVPQQRKEDEKKGAADKPAYLNWPEEEKKEMIKKYMTINDPYGVLNGKYANELSKKNIIPSNEEYLKKNKEFKYNGVVNGKYQFPVDMWLANLFFTNFPLENVLNPETVWEALRSANTDKERFELERPDTILEVKLTDGILQTLSATEKGREFLTSLIQGFDQTAKDPSKTKIYEKGCFDAEVDGKKKEYPSGVVTTFNYAVEDAGGMFLTTKKAFDNFLDKAEEINPYVIEVGEALAVLNRVYVRDEHNSDIKYKRLSDVYKFLMDMYFERLDQYFEFLNRMKDKGDKDATYIRNIFKFCTNPELFVNEDYLSKNFKPRGISKHLGSVVHALERMGVKENLPDGVYELLKWNLAEKFKETVGEEMKKIKDLGVSKTYKTAKKAAKKVSGYVKGALSLIASSIFTGAINVIDPNLVYNIGRDIVQLGVHTDPQTAGISAFLGGSFLLFYGMLDNIFRGVKEAVEEKETEKVLESTRIVTKDGKTYSNIYKWQAEYLPEYMEGREDEYIDSIVKGMKSLIPYIKERAEEIYRSVRKAEDEGYLPLTIGEIFEGYTKMRKTFDAYNKGAFKNARINFASKGMLRYATTKLEATQKAMKKLA